MTAPAPRIERCAALLAAGRLEGRSMAAPPEDVRPRDEREAYAVQDALHRRLERAGLGTVAGHKIGCTTTVMRQFLGIDNPCAGGVLTPTVRHREGRFEHHAHRRVGVECEIAALLGADLPAAAAPFDRDSVGTAVHAVAAAIEVVDDRWLDYGTVDAPSLIADDFFGAGCVLGTPVSDWHGLDLAALAGAMTVNGEFVGQGTGADIMGHPLEALAWLANSAASRGHGLASGEFVLLGSLVQTRWLAPGDSVHVRIDGLGEASAVFP